MTPIRVLVVDDYEPVCRAIYKILHNPRFQIIGQAADGLEAVQKSADLQPDLILLDIGLPQLNGLKAAEQISKVAPHSKILFVTQETDPDVLELALSLGTGGVSKACIQTDLLPAIESVQRHIGYGQDDSTDKGNAQFTQPMPYRFGFDSTNRILHGCFERFVSKQDLRNYHQTAVKHVARLSPNSYVLDVSAVTSTTVTTGTLLDFAKLPPLLPGAERHRFIVAARSAAFWLMRMYAAAAVRTSRRNLHVVDKHAEAWAILGISEPRFNPLPDGEAPSFTT
jgi:DNA-binding NarL/FixJ family response regulator